MPQPAAICRLLRPSDHFWRSTSLICRIDFLFAGISPLSVQKSGQDTRLIKSVDALRNGGSLALESVAGLLWNQWQAYSGISGRYRVEYAYNE